MSVIDEYFENIGDAEKTALGRIRKIVLELVPDAEEVMSYGMPAFKYRGAYLVGFNAFQNHMGFFPTPEPIEKLRMKLSGYKTSKGTIQFTLDNPLPDDVIKEIILLRLKTIEQT